MNIWEKARTVKLDVAENIEPNFSIGFDKSVSKATEKELRTFIEWVENNYRIPITLWVDFEYKHYLISREGERVGYLFYWADFKDYPVFNDFNDIPIIRLPVRTERSSINEILYSFTEAISYYFAWICNEIDDDYTVKEEDINEILEAYTKTK